MNHHHNQILSPKTHYWIIMYLPKPLWYINILSKLYHTDFWNTVLILGKDYWIHTTVYPVSHKAFDVRPKTKRCCIALCIALCDRPNKSWNLQSALLFFLFKKCFKAFKTEKYQPKEGVKKKDKGNTRSFLKT